MKVFLLLTILFSISSCATPLPIKDFDEAINCSPSSLAVIEKHKGENLIKTNMRYDAKEKLMENFENLMECYQDELNGKGLSTEQYNVCLVLETNNKGTLTFIDIEDQDKKLPRKLFSCLVDKVVKINFSKYPETIIYQDFQLRYKLKRSMGIRP